MQNSLYLSVEGEAEKDNGEGIGKIVDENRWRYRQKTMGTSRKRSGDRDVNKEANRGLKKLRNKTGKYIQKYIGSTTFIDDPHKSINVITQPCVRLIENQERNIQFTFIFSLGIEKQ